MAENQEVYRVFIRGCLDRVCLGIALFQVFFFILARGQRILADGLKYDMVQRSRSRSAFSRKYRLEGTSGLCREIVSLSRPEKVEKPYGIDGEYTICTIRSANIDLGSLRDISDVSRCWNSVSISHIISEIAYSRKHIYYQFFFWRKFEHCISCVMLTQIRFVICST